MNKLILLLILSFASIHTEAQKGIISGNIFWKYNDFVGNKPDAGSTIYLYKKDSSTVYRKTQTDVMGNFSFTVDPGQYVIYAFSAETRSDAFSYFVSLRYDQYVEKNLGFNISQIQPEFNIVDSLWNTYLQKGQVVSENQRQERKKRADLVNIRQQYELAAMKLLLQIRCLNRDIQKEFTKPIRQKFKIEYVNVKPEETSTVIINFGITDF